MNRFIPSCRILCVLVLLLLTGCQIPDAYSGKLILNGDHQLRSSSALDGDLVVMGGTFTQQEDSIIAGSIHIFGGQAELSGTVSGNVTVLDGVLILAPQATIRGDLNAIGGSLSRSPHARIDGQLDIRQATNPEKEALPIPSTAGRFAHLLIMVPLLTLIGYLAARFYAAQTRIIHNALTQHPLICTATGLLAMIGGLSLTILMAYTLLLIPVSFLLLGLMLFATTFGAVPTAIRLGNWVVQRFRSTSLADTQAAVLGMALLAALAELLHLIPLIGDLIIIALLLTAFGATLLTHFGSQTFVPDAHHPISGSTEKPSFAPKPAPQREIK